MTNEFSVIGEHIEDERHLLVLGNDGQHYDYSLERDEVSPVVPDEHWRVDPDLATSTGADEMHMV